MTPRTVLMRRLYAQRLRPIIERRSLPSGWGCAYRIIGQASSVAAATRFADDDTAAAMSARRRPRIPGHALRCARRAEAMEGRA